MEADMSLEARLPALLLALLIALTGLAVGEDEAEYPHGDYMDDCSLCHGDESMAPAQISEDFEHPATMPLRGAHAYADCRACHKTLDFPKADPACESCHLDPHRNEFGPDCGRCHTPRSFIDRSRMTRAHLATRFPLRGAHLTVECEDCHRLGSPGHLQWVKTPVECVACHLDDYQATTSPDHEAQGYPTDCELCHRPTRWQGAIPNIDHDALYFPIYSGRHRNFWDGCDTCHTNPEDYSEFTCFNCHQHGNQARTDDDHEEVSGYIYDSEACYACHPDGRE
jgi:hypothetical protein